jgi:hypothetical protein
MACQVVQRSLLLFFKYPLNSFLHNFAVSALQMLVDRDTSITELVESAHVVDQVITHYRDPQWDRRAFWGQLRAISNLIDPYVNPGKYPDWRSVVMKANWRIEELISQKEGILGRIPCLANCVFGRFLESPSIGKLIIWAVALCIVLIGYASCAL